jgi:hypothetical protein
MDCGNRVSVSKGGSVVVAGGRRVCCLTRREWGLGHVLADDGGSKVTVFFVAGGKRTLDTMIAELDLVTGPAAANPILDVAGRVNWQHAHHNLYVIELRPDIFTRERKFAEANPHWMAGQLCVYVGLTGLTPEERFQNHRRGEKDAWYVQKYGQRLLPDLYRRFNPLPYDLAKVMEPELAQQLRENGYGVWQN